MQKKSSKKGKNKKGPIGVFDSGFGGLTVFREIKKRLPQYDYIYLGDNARAPYGTRDFKTIYRYTKEAVEFLFEKGCPLVVLACNTASAKALRTIQQNDLPKSEDSSRRVLGVVRPTTETIGLWTKTGEVGILATTGTVRSKSYPIEIAKFFPTLKVHQQACPLWVPLIENGEQDSAGADYFVEKYLSQLLQKSKHIDTVVLGCTHYPLLLPKIRAFLPKDINIISQGEIVAERLEDYFQRHPELEMRCKAKGKVRFFTTGSTTDFESHAEVFFGEQVKAKTISF